MKNYAYATYIDNEEYIPGLLGLYYSLLRENFTYDFLILTPNKQLLFPSELVNNSQIKIKYIPQYTIGLNDMQPNQQPTLWDEWGMQDTNTLGEFYIFNYEEYDAILFLHCDLIIWDNLDFLFDKYNQNVFYVSKKMGSAIDCYFWLIHPNKKVFEKLSTNQKLLNTTHNANQIAENYISQLLPIQQMDTSDTQPHILHNAGPFKYWKIYNGFNPKDFLSKEKQSNIIQFAFKQINILQETNNLQLINQFKIHKKELNYE